MPTTLPDRTDIVAAAQRLSWRDTAKFLILLARVHWLNRRLNAAHRGVERHGLDIAGPDLVIAARRWLDTHEAIAALLAIPEPPEAAKVRATLRPLDDVRRRAAAAPPPHPARSSRG
ncbi:hypothetical protein ACLBX9_29960 [Methylobacterium sp. A49B]